MNNFMDLVTQIVAFHVQHNVEPNTNLLIIQLFSNNSNSQLKI